MAKVVGLTIPSKLSSFFKYKQEEHGMALWVTTATGYLRIYGALSDSDQLSDLQQNNLKVICQFVVAVYTPSVIDMCYKPSAPQGPILMIKMRDRLINAADFYQFSEAAMNRIQKIFILHAKTWLCTENLALAAYAEDETITRELIERNDREIDGKQLEKVAWDTRYKLADFVTKNTREAPCLLTDELKFWEETMSSNISCERYVGKVKNVIENKQVLDNQNVDERVKNLINLMDNPNVEV